MFMVSRTSDQEEVRAFTSGLPGSYQWIEPSPELLASIKGAADVGPMDNRSEAGSMDNVELAASDSSEGEGDGN